MPMVTILYHSFSGHTRKLSEAVEKGAASVNGVEVHQLEIIGDDIVKGRWDNPEIMAQLDASDAIIFGAPTSIGDVSGPMKCFIDKTSEIFYPRKWADKLAAGFTSSFYPSGDKLHTLQTFVTFAMQQGMIWIGHNAARFEADFGEPSPCSCFKRPASPPQPTPPVNSGLPFSPKNGMTLFIA